MSQLAAMDFDINKKDTQEGDDMVDQNLHKPKITWMTRPNTARLEELRERLRQVKKEMFRIADVAKKKKKAIGTNDLDKTCKRDCMHHS
jgi:uncharacterized protein YktB (UPF0637 family)